MIYKIICYLKTKETGLKLKQNKAYHTLSIRLNKSSSCPQNNLGSNGFRNIGLFFLYKVPLDPSKTRDYKKSKMLDGEFNEDQMSREREREREGGRGRGRVVMKENLRCLLNTSLSDHLRINIFINPLFCQRYLINIHKTIQIEAPSQKRKAREKVLEKIKAFSRYSEDILVDDT